MIEVLPIKLLTEEDAPLFGNLNVLLAKLAGSGLSVASGIVVTSPGLKLKTLLEHFDFGHKEIFEQSLTLVQREIRKVRIPQVLIREAKGHRQFILDGNQVKSVKNLWSALLDGWLQEIKKKLWRNGFDPNITEGLEPRVVVFFKKFEASGKAYYDSLQDEVVISPGTGKLSPGDEKKIVEIVKLANRKLFIPHEYEWILDGQLKLIRVIPYITNVRMRTPGVHDQFHTVSEIKRDGVRSTVKIFWDLSTGFVIEKEIDGIYIASEKIFDLNKPRDSLENLIFQLVESAVTFPRQPVLMKLADMSEGMGKVRGTLRLLHQKSLLEPMIEALDFARHKRGLKNIHVVVPFVRGEHEFLRMKRELAVNKLTRKNSLELWLEIAVPENIINLENYLVAGLDGVVLNLDELIAYLGGFDNTQEELIFYKNEVSGLLKFLEDGIRLLHKSRVPFIAQGNLCLSPQVLEFLVEKGVYGMVVERYEAHSVKDLVYQIEKRMFLRESQ